MTLNATGADAAQAAGSTGAPSAHPSPGAPLACSHVDGKLRIGDGPWINVGKPFLISLFPETPTIAELREHLRCVRAELINQQLIHLRRKFNALTPNER